MQKPTASPIVHLSSIRSASSISFERTKDHEKFQYYCHAVLRVLDLGLFPSFQLFREQSIMEPLKIAFHRGRTFALLRILVHVILIGAAVTEISLN